MKILTTHFMVLCIAVCNYAQTPDCLPNCAEVKTAKVLKQPFDCLTNNNFDGVVAKNPFNPNFDAYITKSQLITKGGGGVYNWNGQMVRFFQKEFNPPNSPGFYCNLLLVDHSCRVLCNECTAVDPPRGFVPPQPTVCDINNAFLINCTYVDAIQDVAFLKDIVSGFPKSVATLDYTITTQNKSTLEIKSATLKGETVFIVSPYFCCISQKPYDIYSCDGTVICSSSCSTLLSQLTNVKQIYTWTN